MKQNKSRIQFFYLSFSYLFILLIYLQFTINNSIYNLIHTNQLFYKEKHIRSYAVSSDNAPNLLITLSCFSFNSLRISAPIGFPPYISTIIVG